MLIIIVILIILVIYLLRNNISLLSIFNSKLNEHFLLAVKDRQKVGTTDSEDGNQPKSTWKSGGRNYESCYSTETRNGNRTGRNDTYFCNQGVDGGEVIPAEGLYSVDMSNYTVHPGKAMRGKPLTGIFSRPNGGSYSVNKDGLVDGEYALTLAQSKSFCDSLKGKCEGFIMGIPTKGTPLHSRTIFISEIEEGWEDPDTYAKMQDFDYTDTQYVSYVKKDVNATEKAIPQEKINAISNKYKNLPTCNWKSANRCIFKDYTYNQGSDSCASNDGLTYSVGTLNNYNEDDLNNWLKTLYNRDMGVNKLASEAINVNEYVERCKDVDGYEFLNRVEAPKPYIPPKKGDIKGRYVRISINNRQLDDNWLHLAEVQVISNNRNIAFAKPTSSSGVAFGGANSKANDGNNDGNYNNGSVSHTSNDGGPQFWEVDLGDASQTIDRIIVSNRTDCCGGRLNNWLLTIYDNNKNAIWANVYNDPPNPKVSIDILQANNKLSTIKLDDFKPSTFNSKFYRISPTEYTSKLGYQPSCNEECHKNACEGEKKKWLGNNQCRDYKAGEFEEEQRAKAALSIQEDEFTAVYRGKAYRVLGGNSKNYQPLKGGASGPLPEGWQVAEDNEDSNHVIQSHGWGANGLITNKGFAYYTQLNRDRPQYENNPNPIFGRNFPHSMLIKTGNSYSPNCGPCAVLLSKDATLSEDDYTVSYKGKLYKCLAGWKKNDPRILCQTWFIDIPSGWRVADNNGDSRHVIMTNAWGTHSMVVNDKRVYGTPSWNTGNFVDGWKDYIDLDQTKGRIRYCMGSFLLVKI